MYAVLLTLQSFRTRLGLIVNYTQTLKERNDSSTFIEFLDETEKNCKQCINIQHVYSAEYRTFKCQTSRRMGKEVQSFIN